MTNDVTFDQISSSLHSLLWLWAAIERAAREEVARAHGGCLPKSAHGIAAVLKAWEASVIAARADVPLCAVLAATLRADLQKPLGVRNGLCHGLSGVSAGRAGRPAALTWDIEGTTRRITWEELQGMFSWLSKVPWAISMISTESADRLGTRMTDTPENRNWWREEYGLEIPVKPAG